jgi:hypothetical protein
VSERLQFDPRSWCIPGVLFPVVMTVAQKLGVNEQPSLPTTMRQEVAGQIRTLA